MREVAPLAARLRPVEDRIEYGTDVHAPVSPARLGGRDEGRDPLPLHIGEVGGIRFAGRAYAFSLPRRFVAVRA